MIDDKIMTNVDDPIFRLPTINEPNLNWNFLSDTKNKHFIEPDKSKIQFLNDRISILDNYINTFLKRITGSSVSTVSVTKKQVNVNHPAAYHEFCWEMFIGQSNQLGEININDPSILNKIITCIIHRSKDHTKKKQENAHFLKSPNTFVINRELSQRFDHCIYMFGLIKLYDFIITNHLILETNKDRYKIFIERGYSEYIMKYILTQTEKLKKYKYEYDEKIKENEKELIKLQKLSDKKENIMKTYEKKKTDIRNKFKHLRKTEFDQLINNTNRDQMVETRIYEDQIKMMEKNINTNQKNLQKLNQKIEKLKLAEAGEGTLNKPDKTVKELDETVKEPDETVEELDETVEELDETDKEPDETVEELDKTNGLDGTNEVYI